MPEIVFRQGERVPNYRKQNSNRDEAMRQESAFKGWLEQGGAQTVNGRNSRAFAIRTIERKLEELGMPFRDLDQAGKRTDSSPCASGCAARAKMRAAGGRTTGF